MTAFWAERSARERLLLGGLGVIVVLYLLTTSVWLPLQRHRANLANDIARYARTMAALSIIPAGSVAAPNAAANAPLPTIITDTAASFQLTIRRLQPTENTADITLEDAPFDTVLSWVDLLERDYGLRMISVTITRRPEPGFVGAALIIGR